MPRRSSTVEYLERLVTWAGGKPNFCALTGIQASNLSAYLAGSKPIHWKRLQTATQEVFDTSEKPEIEYLEQLIAWAGGAVPFRTMTKITQANLSDYRSGSKNIAWKRLRRATEQVMMPAFHPLLEGHDLMLKGFPTVSDLPRTPGLYALFDSAMRVVYYGKATSLYAEVGQTLKRRVGEVRPWTGAKNLTFDEISTYLSAYTIARGDEMFRHDVEALGLRLMVNNTFNKNSGSFKRKIIRW